MVAVDRIYRLEELRSWNAPGPSFAVLGQPIAHSVSPAMHTAALAELALREPHFASWFYLKGEIPPESLAEALPLLLSRGFRGLNLTVPHKVVAFSLVGEIDPSAEAIGAVNTLLATPKGWRGYNTDGFGLLAGIREDLGLQVGDQTVVLLGAGGAARGAALALLRNGVRELFIANRTASSLQTLLRELEGQRPPACRIEGFDPLAPPAHLPAGCLVINATSAGLKPSDPLPLALASLPRPRAVYDMIYNPTETPLLRAAKALGLPGANGLSMLVWQGAKALSLWSGVAAEALAPAMHRAASLALGLSVPGSPEPSVPGERRP